MNPKGANPVPLSSAFTGLVVNKYLFDENCLRQSIFFQDDHGIDQIDPLHVSSCFVYVHVSANACGDQRIISGVVQVTSTFFV